MIGGEGQPGVQGEIESALAALPDFRLRHAASASLAELRREARLAARVLLVYADPALRGGWRVDLALIGQRGKCLVWEPLAVRLERFRSTWFKRPDLPWWRLVAPVVNHYDRDVLETRRMARARSADPLEDARPWSWREIQPLFWAMHLRWPAALGRMACLALYHAAFWPLAAYGMAWGWFHRSRRVLEADRRLSRHVSVFGNCPGVALFKALQAERFSHAELPEPCAEIGVGDGVTSWATFPGRRMCLGIEYLYPDAAAARRRGVPARHLAVGSVYALPVADASLASLALVHTVDHFERLPEALREMARVLKPGGRAHLSSYTEAYPRHTLRGRLLLRWRPNAFPGFERRLLADNVNFNLLPRYGWERSLGTAGLRLEAWEPFLSARIGTAWNLLSNGVEYAVGDVFPFFPRRVRDAAVTSALLPWFLADARDSARSGGVNVFFSARRGPG